MEWVYGIVGFLIGFFCASCFIGSEKNTCYRDVHNYEPMIIPLRHDPINKHVSVGDDVLVKKLDDIKSGTVMAVNKESAVVVMVDGAEEAFDNSLIYKIKE